MRRTILAGATTAILCANLGVAYGAPVETIILRSGQVGCPSACVPGAVGALDSIVSFNPGGDPPAAPLLAQAQYCQGVSPPFCLSFFNATATSGLNATVIEPNPAWFSPDQMCDTDARWINFELLADDGNEGTPGSALYAVPFTVMSSPITSATISLEGGVDDVLGDWIVTSCGGQFPPCPNNDGLYINGMHLDYLKGYPNGGFNFVFPTTHFQNITGMIHPGLNYLYFYQRDLGAGVSGIIFSATITVNGCGTCDGSTLLVDRNVTVDFNSGTPCTDGYGGTGLCAFFTGMTTGTPDMWKAIFDVVGKQLEIAKGVTITTTPVPASGNNRAAPGIEIIGTCRLQVDAGDATTAAGAIVVSSLNQPAGPINIAFDGGVTINGTVLDEVKGTNGTPGDININTICGDIVTGPMSHVVTAGQDHGGSDISLTSCSGDIIVNGLVDASYKAAPASTINVNTSRGSVTIDGNNLIEIEPGTGRRMTSGLTVRSRRDPVAGFINIQAGHDVTVLGNQILTANPATRNYGAVAIKPGGTNGTSGAGAMKVVSLNARIVASDRAFDFANRFNLLNRITLFARGNIDLGVTAGPQAVVSTQGGSAGRGGINTLRSYNTGITIASGAHVLADFTGTPGGNGTNLLTSCAGVILANPPDVKPPDGFHVDDIGICTPGPDSILTLCPQPDPCQ